jgi:metal-responsive CopG/Arc/MetJ family transcriptional regulator
MTKSIKVNQKKRGRPATGRDPVAAVRLPKPVISAVDKWAKRNGIKSRSEAFRVLLGYGLAAAPEQEKS